MFGKDLLEKILVESPEISLEDLAATLVELTAETIFKSYLHFIKPVSKITFLVVTGGGARNPTLMNRLKEKFSIENVIVKTMEDFGINSDAVEAMAFAFFAYETFFRKQPVNIPAVTGAKRKVICGKISYP